ncbi:MAG: pitrilysin family protein [Ginsengibacter sp.]
MTDRITAPVIVEAVDIDLKLLPVDKFKLRNRVQLYYLKAVADEVVNIEWVFNAGNLYETKEDVSLAMCNLIKSGTSTMNAFELTEKIEYYGAFFHAAYGHEVVTLTLSCLSRHLNKLLPIIREIITDSIFKEEEVEIYKQNSLQSLAVNQEKCDYVANNLVQEMVFGPHHPYARSQTESNIKALTRNDILSFFKKYVASGYCRIFAAGKLPADFLGQMDSLFGDLSFNAEFQVPSILVNVTSEKKISRIIDDNGVQGSVRLGRLFPGYNHPDYKKVIVLNTLFGGYFGSRLMNNIREDKGYTYGISSYVQSYRDAGAWFISTEAGREVCGPTVVEVYKEMEDLCNEVVSPEELSLVKNYIIGIYLSQIDGPFKIMDRWKSLILKGFSEDFFYESINSIKHITAEEIQLLAQKYFVANDFKEVVVI